MPIKKSALFIASILFIVPFFWLKFGMVDLGGDGGRLYFLDPGSLIQNLYPLQNPSTAPYYGILPYFILLYFLKIFVNSPTVLIGIEHGIQLSFSFFFVYKFIYLLLSLTEDKKNQVIHLISIVGGIVYISFISRFGWMIALESLHHVFLGPLIFYLLAKFLLTSKYIYVYLIIGFTILFSGNFSFSNVPQLLAFYPFCLVFLLLYLKYIVNRLIPWKRLFLLSVLLLGVHSFHLIPLIASILDVSGSVNNHIFSQESIQVSGVEYFDINRQSWGKLSNGLFQPNNWNNNVFLVLLVPVITILGFLKTKSKRLAMTGLFFLITFYLVSANITLIGVRIYRQLFYIPGFMMFRSFYEKWYYVFVFFYTLLFAFSLFNLLKKASKKMVLFFCLIISIGILLRIIPFIKGSHNKISIYDSNNVSVIFDIDPNLVETLSYIKKLPSDGSFLTLPLTSAYFQIVHGKTQGAYIGLSLVNNIAGKKDYSGFWSFGSFKTEVINAFKTNNIQHLQQLFSLLNIRYIFWNKDPRIIESFNSFPYYEFEMEQLKSLEISQDFYSQLLKDISLSAIYENSYYQIGELPESIVRPTIYIPDIVYSSPIDLLNGVSFQSALLSEKNCNQVVVCNVINNNTPIVSFEKVTPNQYNFTLEMINFQPFLLILSEQYHKSWKLSINNSGINTSNSFVINNYANGWLIQPKEIVENKIIKGTITLEFQGYYHLGRIISFATLVIIGSTFIVRFIKKYGIKKKVH